MRGHQLDVDGLEMLVQVGGEVMVVVIIAYGEVAESIFDQLESAAVEEVGGVFEGRGGL